MDRGSAADTTPAGPRSRWGRSRIGGGSGALITVSLVLGTLLSSGIGWLFTVLDTDTTNPLLPFLVGAVVTLPCSVLLVWVLLVDRSTLAGAAADPDASIESQWYGKAASGAFTDMLPVLGLGAAVFAVLDVTISTALVLGAILTIAVADFAVRYLLAKRAES